MPDPASYYRGRRVLVTGGAGFIGSHLARRLAEAGAGVVVLDDLSTGKRENLGVAARSLIEGSILDARAVREAAVGCEVVFHLAALVSVPLSVEDPALCLSINLRGTERVLEAARDAGAARFVFASSAAVYGDGREPPHAETCAPDCRSPYAASKAAGEALAAAFARCTDLSAVSLRFFNVFGPRQDPHSPYAAAIAAFLDTLRAGREPVIYGDGLQTRDFTPVANVVHAMLLAGASERALRGEVVNVGTGMARTLLDVLGTLAAALGVEAAPRFGAPRAGDVRHSWPDLARARELLGYEPIESFEEGLRSLAR